MQKSSIGYAVILLACGLCFVFLGGQSRECTDNDLDGYAIEGDTCGNICGPVDCDDANPDINPGSKEGWEGDPSCSDGVDNDCDGVADDSDTGCYAGDMVPIPGGCFDMGDHFNEGSSNELPVHNVCISAFEMDVHEVSNAEYAACVDAGACTAPSDWSSWTRVSYYGIPDYDDFPVIYVDWHQARDYCTAVGKRLPTEAEWEYAARGGLAGKRFPWGNSISGTDANYKDSGDPWDNDTSQVEYYAANGYGLYDMAGNVYEWTNDNYQSDYYSVSPVNDPQGPTSPFTFRVLRGGSWSNTSTLLRVAARVHYYPSDSYSTFGFRCAR